MFGAESFQQLELLVCTNKLLSLLPTLAEISILHQVTIIRFGKSGRLDRKEIHISHLLPTTHQSTLYGLQMKLQVSKWPLAKQDIQLLLEDENVLIVLSLTE